MKNIICFLIDDDADDQEIFSMALEDTGHPATCVCAGNGYEALQKLQNEETPVPDFIFLDLNMPLMSGKECLIELKKIDRLHHVPVIIFSTSSLEKDMTETKALGARSFLVKSPRISELTGQLASVFSGDY